MKLKTFEDKRTFEQKTGWRPEDVTDWPNFRVYIPTPEETADRQSRIKPPPEHHYFDIEVTGQDKGKEPELLFMEALFCYYWQFKNGKRHSNKELSRNFTVRKFCQHHEIEKKDLHNLTLASFEVAHLYQSAWQADRYRNEILQQIDLYLKTTAAPEKIDLPGMFADSNDLPKLVKLLKRKKFITETDGKLYWNFKGVEFAAMIKVCLPLLKPKHRKNGAKLRIAWTDYFSHREKERICSPQYFKTDKEHEIYKHLETFSFIEKHFGIE